jgi:hypothetical protein
VSRLSLHGVFIAFGFLRFGLMRKEQSVFGRTPTPLTRSAGVGGATPRIGLKGRMSVDDWMIALAKCGNLPIRLLQERSIVKSMHEDERLNF